MSLEAPELTDSDPELSDSSCTIFACDGCDKSLEGQVRITCLVCKYFDLCCECCFKVKVHGARFGKHTSSHPVQRFDPEADTAAANSLKSRRVQRSVTMTSMLEGPHDPLTLLLDSLGSASGHVEQLLGMPGRHDGTAGTSAAGSNADLLEGLQSIYPIVEALKTDVRQGKRTTGAPEVVESDLDSNWLCGFDNLCGGDKGSSHSNTLEEDSVFADLFDGGELQGVQEEDTAELLDSSSEHGMEQEREQEQEGASRSAGGIQEGSKYVGVCPLRDGRWRVKAYIGGDLKYICDADTEDRAAAYHDAVTRHFLDSHGGSSVQDLAKAIDDELDDAPTATDLEKGHFPQDSTGPLSGMEDACMQEESKTGGVDAGLHHVRAGNPAKSRRTTGGAPDAADYTLNFPQGNPEVDRIMNSNTLDTLTSRHEPKAAYDNDFDLREFERVVLRTLVAASPGGIDEDMPMGDFDDLEEQRGDASQADKGEPDEANLLSGGRQAGNGQARSSPGARKLGGRTTQADTLSASQHTTAGTSDPSMAGPARVPRRIQAAWEEKLQWSSHSLHQQLNLGPDWNDTPELKSMLLLQSGNSASIYARVLQDLDMCFGSSYAGSVIQEERERGIVLAETLIAMSAGAATEERHSIQELVSRALSSMGTSKQAWEQILGSSEAASSSSSSSAASAGVPSAFAGIGAQSQSQRVWLQSVPSGPRLHLGSRLVQHQTWYLGAQPDAHFKSVVSDGAMQPAEAVSGWVQIDVIPPSHLDVQELLACHGYPSSCREVLQVRASGVPTTTSLASPGVYVAYAILKQLQFVVRRRIVDSDGSCKDAASTAFLQVKPESITAGQVELAAEHMQLHGMRRILGMSANDSGSALQPWQVQSVGDLTLGGSWLASAALGPLARRVTSRFRRTTSQLAKGLGIKHADLTAWIDGLPMNVHRYRQVCKEVRRWLSEVRRSGGLWSLSASRKPLPDPIVLQKKEAAKRAALMSSKKESGLDSDLRELREQATMQVARIIQIVGHCSGISKRRRAKLISGLARWVMAVETRGQVAYIAARKRQKGKRGKSKTNKQGPSAPKKLPHETYREYRKRLLDLKKKSKATTRAPRRYPASKKTARAAKPRATRRPKPKAAAKAKKPKYPVLELPKYRLTTGSRRNYDADACNHLIDLRDRHPADIEDKVVYPDELQDLDHLSDSDGDDDHRCTICGALENPDHDPILVCSCCNVRCHAFCNGIGLHEPQLSYDDLKEKMPSAEWRAAWKCDMCAFEAVASTESGSAVAASSSGASAASGGAAAEADLARPAGPLAWAEPLFGCSEADQPERDSCRICFQPPMGLARKPCQGHGWVHVVCAHNTSSIRWKHRAKQQWPDAHLHQIRENCIPSWARTQGESLWLEKDGRCAMPEPLREMKPNGWQNGRRRCTICRTSIGSTIPCNQHYEHLIKYDTCSQVAHPSCALRTGLCRPTWLRHAPPESGEWPGDKVCEAEFDPVYGDLLDTASDITKEGYKQVLVRNESHITESNGEWDAAFKKLVDEKKIPAKQGFLDLQEFRGKTEYVGSGVTMLMWLTQKLAASKRFWEVWERDSGKDIEKLDLLYDRYPQCKEGVLKMAAAEGAMIAMLGSVHPLTWQKVQDIHQDMEITCRILNTKAAQMPTRDLPYGIPADYLPKKEQAIIRSRMTCCLHNEIPHDPNRIVVGTGAGTCFGYCVPRWWTSLHYTGRKGRVDRDSMRSYYIVGKKIPKMPAGKTWADVIKENGVVELWRKRSKLRELMGRTGDDDAAASGAAAAGTGEGGGAAPPEGAPSSAPSASNVSLVPHADAAGTKRGRKRKREPRNPTPALAPAPPLVPAPAVALAGSAIESASSSSSAAAAAATHAATSGSKERDGNADDVPAPPAATESSSVPPAKRRRVQGAGAGDESASTPAKSPAGKKGASSAGQAVSVGKSQAVASNPADEVPALDGVSAASQRRLMRALRRGR